MRDAHATSRARALESALTLLFTAVDVLGGGAATERHGAADLTAPAVFVLGAVVGRLGR